MFRIAQAMVEAEFQVVRAQDNGRVLVNPADQIARHGGGEPAGAHQHMHFARGLGQERRRLARGVAPANDDHFVGAAQQRFDTQGVTAVAPDISSAIVEGS